METQLLETLLRPPETYNDEDKAYLKKNEASLNDEEREKFKDFLTEPSPEIVEPVTPVVETVPENKGTGDQRPIQPALTQQQAESIIDSKIAAMKAEGASVAEQKTAERKLIKFFNIDETDEWTVDTDGKRIPKDLPQNWNAVGNRIVEKLLENPDVLLDRLAAPLRDKLIGMTRQEQVAEQTQIQSINQVFDQEYDAIAQTGAIPNRLTPEGQQINAQIGSIGAKLGIDNYTQAYEAWKMTPREFGGSYVPPNVAAIQEKAKVNRQKEAASKVGSGGGQSDTSPDKKQYSKIAGRTFDQIQADFSK